MILLACGVHHFISVCRNSRLHAWLIEPVRSASVNTAASAKLQSLLGLGPNAHGIRVVGV